MKNKKRLIILITILLLLVPAFLFLVPINKQGRTFVQEVKYKKLLAGAVQPENYDKMKISYAQIVDRQTGTENFNTPDGKSVDDGSILSNQNGNDVSNKDNYLRTNDYLNYKIEIGVALNLNNPDVTETTQLTKGVIKIKATFPAIDEKNYFAWVQEAWMQNVKFFDDGRTIYAEYRVPDGETIVGGNQQLSFELLTTGYTGKLTEEQMPSFEIWMEGNKPDNESSIANMLVVNDPDAITITGRNYFNLRVSDNTPRVNLTDIRDEKVGQYLTFGMASILTYKDYKVGLKGIKYPEVPENNAEIEIKLTYSYRDASSNDETYTIVDTPNLNDTVLVAYNKFGEENENAYPLSTSNNATIWSDYYNEVTRTWQGRELSVNYGDLEATLDGDILKIKIKNFSNNTMEAGTGLSSSVRHQIFADAFELFIPHYRPDENSSYDYQLKYEIISAKLVDDEGNEVFDILADDSTYNKSNTYSFKNYLTGQISSNIYSDILFDRYSGNSFEDGYIYEGATDLITSYLTVEDGPYLGGEERLITFDATKFEMTKINDKWFEYSENNSKGYTEDTPVGNQELKFGIYKNNPSIGLNTDALVNSTTILDFDWYTSKEEAEEHGIVTALYWNNPDFDGYYKYEYLKFNIIGKDIATNDGTTGILRQKVWLYGNAERTQVFEAYTDNSEDSFRPTRYNESYGKLYTGNPYQAGESILFVNGMLNISISSSTLDKNGNYKTSFNVQEEKVRWSFTARDYGQIGETVDRDNVYVGGWYYHKYTHILPETCNIQPYKVEPKNANETFVTWRIEDYDFNGPDIRITCDFAIDPLTPNQYKIEYDTYCRGYTDKYNHYKGFENCYHGQSVTIVNLSGSSTRKTPSKEYIDLDEQFTMTGTINNISDDALNNIKTVELLPKDGDSRNSIIHGSYSLKLTEVDEGVTVYYSTGDVDNIGIETDSLGYNHIQNVDLVNDNRWIPINVGETFPANATAIATLTDVVPTLTSKGFTYQVSTSGNQKGDVYYFGQSASSDNLVENIFSTYKAVTVVDRRISGKVFDDLNRNDIFNSSDAKEKNYTVELLSEDGNKIAETTTDSSGYYEFALADKGKYYVRFANLPYGYELTPKGGTNNHNKANANLTTDLIDHTLTAQSAVEMIGNINLGMRKKPATLTIKYLDKNNDNNLAEPTVRTVYYTDTYETQGLTDIPENYSFLENAGDPVTEVVNKDNIEVIYYYDYTPATVTARHYLDGTTTKIHVDVVQNKKLTQDYETNHLTLDDYDYVRTDGDAEEGTINKTNIVVNYYYKYKVGTVTTHHYLYDNGETTTKLAPDVSKDWNYTQTYTTSTSSEVPQNYEFYKKSENYTAIMSSPNVEVNYYYRLKDSNLTTSITKIGDEEITAKDAEVNYTITYNATVKDYIGDGTITIVDTLPYKIDVDNSDLDGGTYNENNKTITWTEIWSNIDTYASNNNEVTKEIVKNIKLVYDDIAGTDRVMTNTTKGTITLSNNTRDAQDQYSTNIKIKSKIKIIYIDIDTEEELFDSIEEENLVGEQLIGEAYEKDGYILKNKPDTELFIFEIDDQLIKYEYEHIKYGVKGVVLGGGGSITGNEDVYWGENSTEGNIKITAEPGYIIESVIINGEEIDIEPGKEEMVLGQFLNMLEDKNIEVTFIKKPAENPNTRSFIGIFALVISLLVISILFIKRKTFRKNRYEQ